MRLLRVVNTRLQRELGARVGLANRFLTRLRGMLARPALLPGEGLLLSPCSSIHMLGMRYPVDVAFLDRTGAVVAIYPSVQPGLTARGHRNAAHALELPAGALQESGTVVGDVLVWSELPEEQRLETAS
jgi:uncharacterized membrane protein (UPF0127 family)